MRRKRAGAGRERAAGATVTLPLTVNVEAGVVIYCRMPLVPLSDGQVQTSRSSHVNRNGCAVDDRNVVSIRRNYAAHPCGRCTPEATDSR